MPVKTNDLLPIGIILRSENQTILTAHDLSIIIVYKSIYKDYTTMMYSVNTTRTRSRKQRTDSAQLSALRYDLPVSKPADLSIFDHSREIRVYL